MTFLKPHGTKTTSRANSPRMQMQQLCLLKTSRRLNLRTVTKRKANFQELCVSNSVRDAFGQVTNGLFVSFFNKEKRWFLVSLAL